MRGKKSGLETKLREKAPNMLDIGGDTCHVIHGAVKRFCDPFLGFVEKVLDDLNVDTNFSSDIKDYRIFLNRSRGFYYFFSEKNCGLYSKAASILYFVLIVCNLQVTTSITFVFIYVSFAFQFWKPFYCIVCSF